jgi:serine/threonine kinase 16
MLFPMISGGSLRDEITKRNILNDTDFNSRNNHGTPRPFTELEVLHMFLGILKGTKTIHDAGYAHCDIKLENILLEHSQNSQKYDEELANPFAVTPILIDYGSARTLIIKPIDRRTVMNMVDEAARNSTISYRAPELFDGGCRYGPDEPDIDGRSDVWSCGCVLFAIMFGASPFEIEFKKDGNVRIVDCTYLRILGGNIPSPLKNTSIYKRYSDELLELVKWTLQEDRVKRPSLEDLIDKTQLLYQLLGSNSR